MNCILSLSAPASKTNVLSSTKTITYLLLQQHFVFYESGSVEALLSLPTIRTMAFLSTRRIMNISINLLFICLHFLHTLFQLMKCLPSNLKNMN